MREKEKVTGRLWFIILSQSVTISGGGPPGIVWERKRGGEVSQIRSGKMGSQTRRRRKK